MGRGSPRPGCDDAGTLYLPLPARCSQCRATDAGVPRPPGRWQAAHRSRRSRARRGQCRVQRLRPGACFDRAHATAGARRGHLCMPEREMGFAHRTVCLLCRQDEPKRIPLHGHPRCGNFGQARPASSRASCDDRTGQQAVHRLLPSAGSWVPQHQPPAAAAQALEVLLRCSCRSAPHLTRPSAARQSLSSVAAAARG